MQSTVNTHLSLSRQMYISHLNDLEETNLASIHFLAVLSNFIPALSRFSSDSPHIQHFAVFSRTPLLLLLPTAMP